MSIESQTVVGEINKQLSKFEDEISKRQENDSNVGAMVEDSYSILNINQGDHVMQDQQNEQSATIGTFVEDSYVGVQSQKIDIFPQVSLPEKESTVGAFTESSYKVLASGKDEESTQQNLQEEEDEGNIQLYPLPQQLINDIKS